MTAKERNTLIRISLILISITLFGFHKAPIPSNSDLPMAQQSNYHGFVEGILSGEGTLNNGVDSFHIVWNPVHIFLPITHTMPDGRGLIQGERFFTFAQADGNRLNLLFSQASWPIEWDISGIVKPPPDCSIELFIDAIWYPGFQVVCGPLIGCVTEVWPPDFHTGVVINIPYDQAWGEADFDMFSPVLTGGLTAIIYQQATGPNIACDYHLFYPVIPR